MLKRFLNFEFLRFIIIGVINTFGTSAIATLINRFINYNISFIIGYAAGLVISYFLNTYFTFRDKPSLKKFIMFPLTYIPNFIIQYISVLIFVEKFSFQNWVAYISAAIIGVPITFIIMKLLIFNKKYDKN